MKKLFILQLAIATVWAVKADITLLSPVDGAVFHTLTDWQMKVFSGATRQERFEILKGADKKATRKEWRRQRPLVLKWRSTGRDKYPWRICLATKPDMSDARDLWLEKEDVTREKSVDGQESTWEYKVPLANLELRRTSGTSRGPTPASSRSSPAPGWRAARCSATSIRCRRRTSRA